MSEPVANGRSWFHEANDQWPGFGVSIEIDKILHEEQSKYQKIVFFKRWLLPPVIVQFTVLA